MIIMIMHLAAVSSHPLHAVRLVDTGLPVPAMQLLVSLLCPAYEVIVTMVVTGSAVRPGALATFRYDSYQCSWPDTSLKGIVGVLQM